MRQTSYSLYQTQENSTLRLWNLFRQQPLCACGTYLVAATLSGLCIYHELTFVLSLAPAILLIASAYNLIDLSTRTYDQGRKLLGHFLALWSVVAALSLLPTLFYLALSWLFVAA